LGSFRSATVLTQVATALLKVGQGTVAAERADFALPCTEQVVLQEQVDDLVV
jgi:hypothetical protein